MAGARSTAALRQLLEQGPPLWWVTDSSAGMLRVSRAPGDVHKRRQILGEGEGGSGRWGARARPELVTHDTHYSDAALRSTCWC